LVYPFILGLAFAAAASVAHLAGDAWSPKPSWEKPAPTQARVIPRCPR
jgi:hypothetical protein